MNTVSEKNISGADAQNPLGSAPIGGLILKYAIPSIISTLVVAAYNITDQIFIGNIVGMYGNAATNVAFPLVTFCTAVSLMFGVGTASNFNISMGARKRDDAVRYVGSGISMAVISGLLISVLALIFLEPLLRAFGATENVFSLAIEYTRITAFGIPFLVFSSFGSFLIRADGKPTFSMICTITGAVINIFFDALFMIVFKWGITGAACATIIGQIVSGIMVVVYMTRFRSVKITRKFLRPQAVYILGIIKLGIANFFNHFLMMVVQITLNNIFRSYGAQSIYGSDIPLAVSGVIAKISIILQAFTVGIAQGCQPIWSFNTGAKNSTRIKDTYKRALVYVLGFSVLSFAAFQIFPRQIVSIFGTGNELYFEFAERYMRIFMMMVCIFGIQPLTINFFTSTGKARQGVFLTLSRQGIFLLPLLIILPNIFGLDGALYAAPIADFLAVALCIALVIREMKRLTSSLEQVSVD